MVTKPGLGLEVGGPAINPTPRRMIQENLAEVESGILESDGLRVVVSVPAGRELAPKTDNPRLGIRGGISILGTSGIVIPFSTASFAASIRQSVDVISAMGRGHRRAHHRGTQRGFAREVWGLPDHCFVQMGDFSGYAVKECGRKGLRPRKCVAGFVGKLAKMAAGVSQTHVKGSKVDTGMLAEVAAGCGAAPDAASRIRTANTARHVMDIVLECGIQGFFDMLCAMTKQNMAGRAPGVDVEVVMFGFDGSVLGPGLGRTGRHARAWMAAIVGGAAGGQTTPHCPTRKVGGDSGRGSLNTRHGNVVNRLPVWGVW